MTWDTLLYLPATISPHWLKVSANCNSAGSGKGYTWSIDQTVNSVSVCAEEGRLVIPQRWYCWIIRWSGCRLGLSLGWGLLHMSAAGGAGVNDILILWRWLRLYLNVRVAHGLLIRRWWVSSTSSPWCDLRAWISWAAVDAEFWLVAMVVIPSPMVHRDHRQDVVVVRVSQAGAALRALARVAAPHSDGDDGDDEHDQQQWHNQVEGVDSADHRLQPSRWTALPHVFLPEPPLQPITKRINMVFKQAMTHVHPGRLCGTKSGLMASAARMWISAPQRQRTATAEQKSSHMIVHIHL